MNDSTDFARAPAENAGVFITTLGADRLGAASVVATLISLSEKDRPAGKVPSDARKSRGIPELDSPMAG